MLLQTYAEYFLNAFQILKESNEDLINREKKLSQYPSDLKAFGVLPIMGVDVVCLAFSVELYIKALHYELDGKVPHKHSIYELFEKLPKEIQQEVFSDDSISLNQFYTKGNIFSTKRFNRDYSKYDGFIDKLNEISNAFIEWRYSFEHKSLSYDVSFVLALIESLKKTTAKVRKHKI